MKEILNRHTKEAHPYSCANGIQTHINTYTHAQSPNTTIAQLHANDEWCDELCGICMRVVVHSHHSEPVFVRKHIHNQRHMCLRTFLYSQRSIARSHKRHTHTPHTGEPQRLSYRVLCVGYIRPCSAQCPVLESVESLARPTFCD